MHPERSLSEKAHNILCHFFIAEQVCTRTETSYFLFVQRQTHLRKTNIIIKKHIFLSDLSKLMFRFITQYVKSGGHSVAFMILSAIRCAPMAVKAPVFLLSLIQSLLLWTTAGNSFTSDVQPFGCYKTLWPSLQGRMCRGCYYRLLSEGLWSSTILAAIHSAGVISRRTIGLSLVWSCLHSMQGNMANGFSQYSIIIRYFTSRRASGEGSTMLKCSSWGRVLRLTMFD